MKFKKRHIVLASLVLALSLAVFLNWHLSSDVSVTATETGRELGVATYVNSSLSSSDDETQVSTSGSDSSANLSDEQIEYFASSRAERQRTQDSMLELAKQVLELADSSDEAKEEAAEQLSALEERILNQNRIETTLKAKGFSDCLCCLNDFSCTIIVPDNELKDNSALVIKDCVDEVVDISFENISIVGA